MKTWRLVAVLSFVAGLLTVGGGQGLAALPCAGQGLLTALPIAKDGKTDYAIVIAQDAPAPEKFAAEELQVHLKKATGATFPILGNEVKVEGEGEQRKVFLLRRVGKDEGFESEECRVRTDGAAIVIEGEGDRGVPYGVYAFLERKLGARWFTSCGDEKIDRRPTLVLEPFAFAEKQPFAIRGVLTFCPRVATHPEGLRYAFRNRLNVLDASAFSKDKTVPPGAMVSCEKVHEPFCHNFFFFLPPTERATTYYGDTRYRRDLMPKKTYGKDHPEWYGLKENGQRAIDDYVAGQLCFSNEEMCRELEKNFLAFVAGAGGEGVYALDPQDGGKELCLCDACKKTMAKYQAPGAPFFLFVQRLAKAIAASYPKAKLKVCAYGRGRCEEPPVGMAKFPDNVVASYAPRKVDYSKAFTAEADKQDLLQFKAWSALAPTLNRDYTFVYAVGLPPYHCFPRIAATVRLASEFGSIGCNFEHDEGTHEGRNFADMQTWILLQLYRFPTANWHDLAKEFCDGVFGPAADEMLAVVDLYQKANDEYAGFQNAMSRPEYALTAEKLVAYQALFAKAEAKSAGDAKLLQRIREVRLGFDSETIAKYRDIKKICPDYPDTPGALCERGTNAFIRARHRRGQGYGAEGKEGPYPYLGLMSSGYARASVEVKPLPPLFDKFDKGDIVEIFPQRPGAACQWVQMKDAAMGYATWNFRMDGGNPYVPKPDHRMPFAYGFYDCDMKRAIFRGKIEKQDVVPDEFHFYKLGRGTVPNASALLYVGWDWNVNENPGKSLGGDPAAVYDFYVSIKFEGPTYCGEKSKKTKDAFYVDRYVLVRVK